jgi:hypothetical protein
MTGQSMRCAVLRVGCASRLRMFHSPSDCELWQRLSVVRG